MKIHLKARSFLRSAVIDFEGTVDEYLKVKDEIKVSV
jgi:hypothetical protein